MKKVFLTFLVFLCTALLIYFLAPGWILEAKLKVEMMSGGFSERTVNINELEYHYFDNNNSDKPNLVMLHGFADRKESWFPFVNQLSGDFRIILPDAAGHGHNEQDANADHSLNNQAEFIRALTRELNLEPFHLVGISMGGGIAGKYAAAYPEDLRSLTFISSAGMQDCETPSQMDVLMERYSNVEEKKKHFPLLPDDYSRANARLFKEYIFHKNIFAPNRLFREYTRDIVENKEFYIEVLDDFVDIGSGRFLDPLDEELEGLQCPVNIIWGKQDPLLHVSCVDKMVDYLTQKPDIVLIDDCGHATIAERPKATYRAMDDFYRKVIR